MEIMFAYGKLTSESCWPGKYPPQKFIEHLCHLSNEGWEVKAAVPINEGGETVAIEFVLQRPKPKKE